MDRTSRHEDVQQDRKSPNSNNKHHFYDHLTVSAEYIMYNIYILVKVGGTLL